MAAVQRHINKIRQNQMKILITGDKLTNPDVTSLINIHRCKDLRTVQNRTAITVIGPNEAFTNINPSS